MLAFVWLPIVLIGLLHYGTSPEHVWAHNVLRRVYYLPIVVASFLVGLRGGLLSAAFVSLSYLPHAFFHIGHGAHSDPAPALEKALELVLFNAIGAVSGYLSDLERRRRRELGRALAEQQRLQQQLVRAGRLSALGQVVAGIAHEIRNPLHALRGTAEIVDPLIGAERAERRMWDIHLGEIERLDRAADRFLSFAKPRALEATDLDLREVVRRLDELVGTQARKKGIRIESALPPEPVRVRGDRDQLAQVALNIALNAVQAIGDDGGQIRISLAVDEGAGPQPEAVLRIENDGPPIEAEQLGQLFDPFCSGRKGGAGLGLSISERIVEQHGGEIRAANVGLGVSFTVRLPLLAG